MAAHSPDIDALLAHADWLGKLSRQLCRDQHEADDAAQEALLASLRTPPLHQGNLRGFLAHILRNVLRWRRRSEQRRRRRELATGPHDFAEAAAVAAARAEIHQALGRLVLALPEPQRALVLHCYFDGEDTASIAKRASMSQDAVHSHLRRARHTLRTQLQTNGSDRKGNWALLLLRHRPWLVPTLLMTMTLKAKVAATVVATAAAAMCIWAFQPDVSPPAPDNPAHAAAPAAPVSTDIAPQETPPLARAEVATSPAAVPVPPPAGTTNGRLTGTIVDFAGRPVAGALVYALPFRDGQVTASEEMRGDSDARGRFEMASLFDADVLVVAIPLQPEPDDKNTDRRMIIRLRPDLTAAAQRTTITRHQDHSIGELRLPAAVSITGVVRTPGQVGVAGVPILWHPDPQWDVTLAGFGVCGLPGGGIHIDNPDLRARVRTDATGRFVIPTTTGVSGYLGLMSPTGYIEYLVEIRKITAPADVAFDLAPPACVRVLTEGKPTAGVSVGFDKRLSNYVTNDAGEVRILRERTEPLRGSIARAGREALEFDVPAEACPEQPKIVTLDTATAPTTLIQVTITSEIPLRSLRGGLSRLDLRAGGITLRPEPGDPLITLTGRAPPGRYRLTLGTNYNAPGNGNDSFVLTHQQELTLGSEPLQLAAQLRHGGRIRCTVRASDGQFVGGKARLVAADGTESAPSFYSPSNGLGQDGHLWESEPSVTFHAMLPGRYELVLDLGAHGTHRRFVDVRVCEIADVTITLP